MGRATGATVNDVVVASVAGALRRYMQGRGQAVDGIDVRAMVRVHIRLAARRWRSWATTSAWWCCPCPWAWTSRWAGCTSRQAAHGSTQAYAGGQCNLRHRADYGHDSDPEERLVLRFFTSKTSVVMTNVIGPRHKLYLAGNPIRQVNFWVPQTAGIGLGISIFSYAGEVVVGIMANAKLVPDPETIVDAFEAEFVRPCRLS